jgi:hypothetical protein
MQVIIVLWGTGSYDPHVSSTGTPSMASFYEQVLAKSTLTTSFLQQYNTPSSGGTGQTFGVGQFVNEYTITPSVTGSTVDDTQIQSEITAQINAGHLPAPLLDTQGNPVTYYAVYFPPGITITQGGSSSCVAGGFCAYHGTIAASGGLNELFYGVHPDMQAGSGCATGCGTSTTFGNYTSVASHEMTETLTDAEVGLATVVGPPLAWYDSTNGEIGDICNGQQTTYAACDGQTYTLQQEFSNSAPNGNACVAPAAASCGTTADFTISATAASVTQGSTGTSTVSTTQVGNAGTVSLTASGIPSGVTASFSPTSVAAGGSSTLTFTASSSAAVGTYTVTVTGTEGTNTHSATLALTVSASTTPDFTIAASPTTMSFTQGTGGSGNSTISTTAVGSAGTVSLTTSVSPAGPTASVSPTSVTAGGSATLTVTVGTTVGAGTYTVTVTGTEGSKTHSTTVTVTVNAAGTGIINGGFEAGSFTGWTTAGASETVVNSGCHGGTYCARLGNTTPTNSDSTASQTFTAPTGTTGISLWYKMTCPDTVTYDWATVTLKDNTAGTTAMLLSKVCTTNAWTNLTGSITAGHSYTLTLLSHDDNYPGDPTYTLYDDVTLTSGSTGGGITNGGFETGNLSGWTASGASETVVNSGCHSGTYCAQLGSTSPTNGDSTVSQTFTVPTGKSVLSFWFKETCPDTVTYDWATVTLKDNTTGTTATLLTKTCTSNSWTQKMGSVVAGHSYTITLTSHDDNYPGDPTYTLYDDVVLQ